MASFFSMIFFSFFSNFLFGNKTALSYQKGRNDKKYIKKQSTLFQNGFTYYPVREKRFLQLELCLIERNALNLIFACY